ncbi:MAG: hypothetical protein BWX70_03326 [Verrucomicrobia bacterium ADurb.Bin070]|nr:MAG: hypothetical protein BWX70_03326 [Verrucomicrobia bacterium ADurb.Bin070]
MWQGRQPVVLGRQESVRDREGARVLRGALGARTAPSAVSDLVQGRRADCILTDGRRIRQTAFPRNRWLTGGCAFSACFARGAVGSAGVPARTEKGRARFRCAVWRSMNTRPAFYAQRCCGRGRPRSRLACFPFHPEHRTFANPGRQPITLSADGAVRVPGLAHLFHQKRMTSTPRSPSFTYTMPPLPRVRERVPLRCERVRPPRPPGLLRSRSRTRTRHPRFPVYVNVYRSAVNVYALHGPPVSFVHVPVHVHVHDTLFASPCT